MKTVVNFIGGMAIGYVIGTLFAPLPGSELRSILFGGEEEEEDSSMGHTFSISELVSPNSDSLERIKEKIQHSS